MIKRLIEGLRRQLSRPDYPAVQADSVIYAVGDVHGRLDLLMPLMDRVLRDAMLRVEQTDVLPQLVFVGDMIDRGPDSRGVLEMMMSVREWPELETHFLMGNHEEMLLRFLEDPFAGRSWLRYGGYETLLSYGIEGMHDLGDREILTEIATALGDVMGSHVEFLRSLERLHCNGNIVVTHAGADPALAPEAQPDEVLFWGVDDFHKSRRSDGLWIVHGHTIVETPTVRDGRIAIDTGAYRSGRLSVLKVDGSEISFLTEIGAPGRHEED